MKIQIGGTRIVFLFKNYVLKIPRIRIYKYLFETFLFLKSFKKRSLKENLLEYKFIFITYLFAGFLANFREYLNSSKNDYITETTFFFFITIQKRGNFLYKSDPRWKKIKFLLKKLRIRDYDALSPKNYSILEKRVVLHDYGSSSTIKELYLIINSLKCL